MIPLPGVMTSKMKESTRQESSGLASTRQGLRTRQLLLSRYASRDVQRPWARLPALLRECEVHLYKPTSHSLPAPSVALLEAQ